MNDSRFQWKVGLFVAFGLALAALLILNFSKGITLFQSTYRVHVTMPTVAGLKPAADVMLAGVPIGKVVGTTLSLDGRSVDVTVEILGKYKIRRDAKFHIDSQGFLGDQYIEVTPAGGGPAPGQGAVLPPRESPLLTNGEVVAGEEPFNMQEAVRSISGLLDQARMTVTDIRTAVTNINHSVLAADTLSHVALALSNFDAVTADAAVMSKEVRGIIDTNGPTVHVAITNFVTLSRSLNDMAGRLDQTISTNSEDVTVAVKNLRAASVAIKELADGLQAGQGLAGGLLKDPKMREQLDALLTNANAMTEQFSLFGLRLNENGLWNILWKPKPPKTNSPSR
jgi:phospholipid/cholesterol/gamma-HCH transport system substrate-binding protein